MKIDNGQGRNEEWKEWKRLRRKEKKTSKNDHEKENH